MSEVKPSSYSINADAVFEEALASQQKRETAAKTAGAEEVPLEVEAAAPAADAPEVVPVTVEVAASAVETVAPAVAPPTAAPAPPVAAPAPAPAPPPRKTPQDVIIEALIRGKTEALEALKQTQREAKDLLDARARIQAEFENYKKRVNKDKQDAALQATRNLMRELLPVVDNLERALAHIDPASVTPEMKTVHQGLQMVSRQMGDAFKKLGVTAFTTKGQPFDPARHEAVAQAPAEGDVMPGTVMEEHQRGYLLGDVLLRPALVVVAGPKA